MYCISIKNHRVIGHPYIPICKFQVIAKTNEQEYSEESQYINPPINGLVGGALMLANKKVQGKNTNSYNKDNQRNINNNQLQQDQSYLKQFPINFSSLKLKQEDLTNTGRQKPIGFSKLIINYEVMGRITKHKIMKVNNVDNLPPNKAASSYNNNQSQLNSNGQQVLSIVDISIEQHKGSTSVKKLINLQQQDQQQQQQFNDSGEQRNQYTENQQQQQQLQRQHQQQSQQRHYQKPNNKSLARFKNQPSQQQLDQNAKFTYNFDEESYYVSYKPDDSRNGNYYVNQNNNLNHNKNNVIDNILNNKVSGKIYKQVENTRDYLLERQRRNLTLQQNKLGAYHSKNSYNNNADNNGNIQYSKNQDNDQNAQSMSRRYLIPNSLKHQRLLYNESNHQHSITKQNTSSILQNNISTNSKTKRRLKYILSTNELRYVVNDGNNSSISDSRKQKQLALHRNTNQGQKVLDRVVVKSPIVSRSGHYQQQQQKLQHSQQHNKTPNQNHPNLTMSKQTQNKPQLPLQQRQPVEYFIDHQQKNVKKQCYLLKNLYIVYQVQEENIQIKRKYLGLGDQQFEPKFITFLTYNSYEKIAVINCLSDKLAYTNINNKYSKSNKTTKPHKVKYLNAKESSHFILKSHSGEIKKSAVCDLFSDLHLLLPKQCLIFRVEIIMKDESIYIGTLANQIGNNVKSTLHLKKSLNNVHQQPQRNSANKSIAQKQQNYNPINQSVNLIVDICDLNALQQQEVGDSKTKNEQLNQQEAREKIFSSKSLQKQQNTNSRKSNDLTYQSLQKPSPSRRKQTKKSTIDYFPHINLTNGLQNSHSSPKYLQAADHSKNIDNKNQQGMSQVEKTLNAITAYKICLSPMTSPVYENERYQSQTSHNRTGLHYPFQNSKKSSIKKYYQKDTKQNQNHILLQQDEHQNESQHNNHLNQQSDIQYLMRNGITDLKMNATISKDLPKIIIHRSNLKPLNLKKQQFKNIKDDLQSQMINKRIKSVSHDQFKYKNQVRLQFFKKILGNRFGTDGHKHSSIQSIVKDKKKNNSKRSHSKSKALLDQKKSEMQSKRYKKLKTLPYYDLNSTKVFLNDPKSKYQKHTKLSVSPTKLTSKHTYARELKCMKEHCLSNSSILTNNDNQPSHQIKNITTYRLSIRKIDFLKLLDNNQVKTDLKKKKYGTDNENSELQLDESQAFKKEDKCEVFLKIFNESKKKKQFVTSSQCLKQIFNQQPLQMNHIKTNKNKQRSYFQMSYLSCSWILSGGQFLYKKIKADDLLTVQAYGDLASVDNHEFLGKCIFSVQEMIYMKHQKKITGYLVKKKSIQSHVTVHFEISENS